MSGAFWAVGQNCISVQRIYVQEKIYTEFKNRFVEHTRKYKTGYQLDEGIERANAVDFGLRGAIFNNNVGNAFKAIKEMDVGGIIVNDSTDYRIDLMPFGGVKNSGLGREGIKFALQFQ